MDQAAVWQAVLAWPAEEQRAFAARVLDQFEDECEPDDSPEFLAELDRRCAELDANPTMGRTWEQVAARARGQA